MIHNRTVTALVPIKEHSERVTGKNFRTFCGQPLYQHIIRTLDHTYAVDEIVIDTDSPRVQLEAPGLSSKVRVIERPEEIRGDFVSMNKVIEYDLTQSDGDIYVQTHATSPLLKSETIASALGLFVENEESDSLFGVTRHQNRFYFPDGRPANHDPAHLARTQDLDPLWEENSTIYVFTKESFAATGQRIGAKPYLFEVPHIEATDIDDEYTFLLAEMLAMYAHPPGS